MTRYAIHLSRSREFLTPRNDLRESCSKGERSTLIPCSLIIIIFSVFSAFFFARLDVAPVPLQQQSLAGSLAKKRSAT